MLAPQLPWCGKIIKREKWSLKRNLRFSSGIFIRYVTIKFSHNFHVTFNRPFFWRSLRLITNYQSDSSCSKKKSIQSQKFFITDVKETESQRNSIKSFKTVKISMEFRVKKKHSVLANWSSGGNYLNSFCCYKEEKKIYWRWEAGWIVVGVFKDLKIIASHLIIQI